MIKSAILNGNEIMELEENFVAMNGRNSTDGEMIQIIRDAELEKVGRQQDFFNKAAREYNERNNG